MYRKSTFLAIALSVTAICSATVPAAAFPSQYFGGANIRLPVQLSHLQSPAAAPSIPAAGPKPNPFKIPVSGSPTLPAAGTTPAPVKMPMPKYTQGVSTKLGPLEVPVAQLPSPLPPKPPIPIDNVCPDNPAKCPPAGSGPTTNGNPGNPRAAVRS
jgi:hypothetical protein